MREVSRDLVEAAQQGDRQAWEELVGRTHQSVYTLAYRLVGNPDDAADVVQDVYVRVVAKLAGFRHEAALSTWLYRVTTNVALRSLSVRSRRDRVEGGDLPEDVSDPGLGPAEIAEEQHLGGDLERLLAELPEGQRTVVVLRDVYGFSTEEVAQTLGVSAGAVKVRLFRARERLKEELGRESRQVAVPSRRRRGGQA